MMCTDVPRLFLPPTFVWGRKIEMTILIALTISSIVTSLSRWKFRILVNMTPPNLLTDLAFSYSELSKYVQLGRYIWPLLWTMSLGTFETRTKKTYRHYVRFLIFRIKQICSIGTIHMTTDVDHVLRYLRDTYKKGLSTLRTKKIHRYYVRERVLTGMIVPRPTRCGCWWFEKLASSGSRTSQWGYDRPPNVEPII